MSNNKRASTTKQDPQCSKTRSVKRIKTKGFINASTTKVDRSYNSVIQHIRNAIGNEAIYISVSETLDNSGSCIVNVVVGTLSQFKNRLSGPHLLKAAKKNVGTLAYVVNSAVSQLGPQIEERVLLLLTDATQHMLELGGELKKNYSNIIHLTCLGKAFERVAEVVRYQVREVHKLMTRMRDIISGAPYRVGIFQSKLKQTPLPPDPILSGYAGWLETALFYAENYEKIKEVIASYDENEAQSVKLAHGLFNQTNLRQRLELTKTNFGTILKDMKELRNENSTKDVIYLIKLVDTISAKLQQCKPENDAKKYHCTWQIALDKNPGLEKLREIITDLSKDAKDNSEKKGIMENYRKFKFAPMTVCDVESTFPAYKTILFCQSHEKDFEKLMIVHCSPICKDKLVIDLKH